MVRPAIPRADLDAARPATVVHGHGFSAVVRRHSLAAFFVLAYVFSWSYWLALALAGGHGSHFPGLLGPLLAAFTVTFVDQGRAGAVDLLSRMFRWRVRLRWYAAALVPAVAGSAAVVFLAVAENRWPTLHDLSTMPGLPAAGFGALLAMVLVVNGYGEEVGWRGFAWTRLRERHSIAGAAALLGIVWAGWHLPVFWLDTGMRNLEWFVIPGWIIGLMAGAVVLGWLYERACSSLLIVAIFHTLLNVASATLATEGLPAAVTTMAVIIWAIVILRRERSRPEPGPTEQTSRIQRRRKRDRPTIPSTVARASGAAMPVGDFTDSAAINAWGTAEIASELQSVAVVDQWTSPAAGDPPRLGPCHRHS